MDIQECCIKSKIAETLADKAARRENLQQEFARTIRAAREDAGYSLDAVAHKSRISLVTLRAMEYGRFDLLPGVAFVRGFVRNLCVFYGIPHEKLMMLLNEAVGAEEGIVEIGLLSLENKSLMRTRARYSVWSKMLKKMHTTLVVRYFHVGQVVNTIFFGVMIVGGLYCGVKMFGKLFNDDHLLKIARTQPAQIQSVTPGAVGKGAMPLLPDAPAANPVMPAPAAATSTVEKSVEKSALEKSSEKSSVEKLLMDKNQRKKKNIKKF